MWSTSANRLPTMAPEAARVRRAEIQKLLGRDGMIVGQFMPDYGRLRDQVRACRGQT